MKTNEKRLDGKTEKATSKDSTLIKFASALAILIFSSLSVTRTGKFDYYFKSLFLPEIIVYMIFGLLNAFIYSEQIKKVSSGTPTLDFLSNWLLFTGFYKLVLLPSCTLGVCEWIIAGLMFACEFGIIAQSKIKKKPNFDSTTLIVFGMLLWLFKLVIFNSGLKNFIADVTENDTIMTLIAIMLAVLAIFGVVSMIRCFKLTGITEKTASTAANAGKEILAKLASIIKTLVKTIIDLIVMVITNPIILLITCIVALCILGGSAIVAVHKTAGMLFDIRNDIAVFVTKFLGHITDYSAYSDSVLNTIGTAISFVIFICAYQFDLNSTRKQSE